METRNKMVSSVKLRDLMMAVVMHSELEGLQRGLLTH